MSRLLFCLALIAALQGCATAPVLRKQSFDFKTTALFKLPCDSPTVLAALAEREGLDADDELETDANQCNSLHMLRMVETFMTIKETDESRGVVGDTLEQVRAKGFTIFADSAGKRRRPNTRPLYGNDALAAVGMGVSPPPLQRPEEIKAYADFMAQHYGEEYYEKDMKHVSDRFCLNRRESLEVGDDRIFAIVWRGGHVFKRVIKGGPVNNPKQERAFLLCPGGFIIDTVTGGLSTAAKGFVP